MCTSKSGNDGLEALVDFVRGQAYCPCCEGVEECWEGCTIEDDCNKVGGVALHVYGVMIDARTALAEFSKHTVAGQL